LYARARSGALRAAVAHSRLLSEVKFLITTDCGTLDAARSVNASNVRSLTDHERLLALPYAQFREEIDRPRNAR